MMTVGFLLVTTLLSLARAADLEISGPVQAKQGSVIGSIAIEEEMHFSMDITVHSITTTHFENVFHCGTGKWQRLPAIFLASTSGTDGGQYEGFQTCWLSDSGNDCVQTSYVTAGQTYHFEIDITPTVYTITQDGVEQYSGPKEDHTSYDSMVCYVSDPWYGNADVTLSNIKIVSGGETTTAAPTPSPTETINALLEMNNEKLGFLELIYGQLVEMNSWLMTAFDDHYERATNLLCDTDSYSTIKGQWSYDDSDCSLENTDSDAGNIVWFGSVDGLTPDDSFDDDSFTMTASLEIHSGSNAGILFRTGESSTKNDEGPTYYVGLIPASDKVVFGTMDDGWSAKHTASVALEYDHIYTLSVEASGDLYSVYIDDVVVFEDIARTEFGSGSIGLRTFNAPTTYHSLSYVAEE